MVGNWIGSEGTTTLGFEGVPVPDGASMTLVGSLSVPDATAFAAGSRGLRRRPMRRLVFGKGQRYEP
jgi:hypothetical protein